MIYEAESGDLTLVASGDCMITRKLSVFREPSFVSLVDMFRKADVGYTNLEMLMHDFEHVRLRRACGKAARLIGDSRAGAHARFGSDVGL